MKILLISGHGAGDPGAVSAYGTEADETRVMVNLVRERLSRYAEVFVYPQSRNCFQDNYRGQLQVDFRDYDYVLEFHMNQSAPDRRGQGNGHEILVHPAVSGVTVEQAIARKVCALGFEMRRDQGLWRTDGGESKYLNMDTCIKLGVDYALAETCFIDNQSDMAIYRDKFTEIADAYVAGIVEGFGLAPVAEEVPNPDALMLREMTSQEYIEYMGKLAKADWEKNRILPSPTIAQAIKEPGYGKLELACGLGASEENIRVNGTRYGARNVFGMKKDISVGTWESTIWDGSVYRKQTAEQNEDGTYTNIFADFRAYETIADNVEDRAQYLTNARDETGKLRFAGIVGETDPDKVCHIIAAGGYATSLTYEQSLKDIIRRENLTRFDPVTTYEPWIAKVVNAAALNVRRTPNGEIVELNLDTLPLIKVIGEAKDSDGDTWYKVTIGEDVTGYVWPGYVSR